MIRPGLIVVAALLAAPLSGCALLTKSKPVELRYLTPEVMAAPGVAPSADPRVASNADVAPVDLQLRLGRVVPAAYLRDRVAFRDTTSEVGFYEKLRWAEPPEAYLRRGLARALFQRRGIHEVVSGSGPSLEIDLDTFDELRAPRRAARIQVTWRLREARTVLVQRTLTVERPIGSDKPEALAAAMAEALAETIDGIVSAVVSELSRRPAPADTASAPPASP